MRPPHLQRLAQVWSKHPVYFITTCSHARRKILADEKVATVLREEWQAAPARHGWHIGRYVIMPDHVHFFATAETGARSLSVFMAKWKEWTAKRCLPVLNLESPLWQIRFFDHLLRTPESHAEKWEYIRNNPVRAGLVKQPDDCPFQGFIHFE
jgi:putative transposase